MQQYIVLILLFAAGMFCALKGPRWFLAFVLIGAPLGPRFAVPGFPVEGNALWLAFLLLVCTAYLFVPRPRSRPEYAQRRGLLKSRLRWYSTAVWICVLLGWLVVATFRAESIQFSARTFCKMVFPFCLYLFAKRQQYSRTYMFRVIKAMVGMALISSFLGGGIAHRLFPSAYDWAGTFLWARAGYAMYSVAIVALALCLWDCTNKWLLLSFAAYQGISCVLLGARIAILGLVVLLAMFSYRFLRPATATVVSILLGGLITVAFFLIPSMAEDMWSENVEMAAVLREPTAIRHVLKDSGRFNLWADLADRFFVPHPILGSGLGVTQYYLYGLDKGAKVAHNSHLALLCEVGIVGWLLYMLAGAAITREAWLMYKSSRDPMVRNAAFCCVSLVVVLILFMVTDNILDYVRITLAFPAAFVAIVSSVGNCNVSH